MEGKTKKLPKIITSIIFVVLLVGTMFSSQQSFFKSSFEGNRKSAAIANYGFYLEPVNQQAHINFKHIPPALDAKVRHIAQQVAPMGASVSICDFDRDGWNDIYFTNSGTGTYNALYKNMQDGTFEDVALTMGVGDLNQEGNGSSMGAIWGDYDNDGFEDLFVYKWGRPELFRNNGGKSFTNMTPWSGLPIWVNANSALWLDFDGDGLLDLFLGGYFQEKFDLQHLNTTKIMTESFEYSNNGGRNYLLRNEGDGTFTDVTEAYGLTSTRWTLAAGAADLNGDRFPELVVANDYSVDELYINKGGKTFEEIGRKAKIGYTPKSGMSVSFGDADNSDDLGIYITNITENGILVQGNSYWKPKLLDNKEISYLNLAQLAGIESGGWSYCAQFGDLNNDGYMDLYQANGYISGEKDTSYWYDYSKITGGHKAIISDAANWPAMQGKTHAGYQQNKVWVNNKHGIFKDVSDDVCPEATFDSRSVAMVDLWNRGVLDVVVANQNESPIIYKNSGTGGNHWISFELEGTESNRSAIGAKVVMEWDGKKQSQVVTGGIGFSSQNQRRIHFGLGKDPRIQKVTIYWPSGKVQELENPSMDKIHHIKEGKTTT
jgi:hypothetical protein